jgi:hypothetical protein
MKRLLKNKKGTAEVIGSVMFIIILLFFFTNVYLWHDAKTKEMNDLYVQKINSPITVSAMSSSPYDLNVTNKGGMDAKLSLLWIDVSSNSGPDAFHGCFNLTQSDIVISAGSSIKVSWSPSSTLDNNGAHYNYVNGDKLTIKVITTLGNSASCSSSIF